MLEQHCACALLISGVGVHIYVKGTQRYLLTSLLSMLETVFQSLLSYFLKRKHSLGDVQNYKRENFLEQRIPWSCKIIS